MTAAAFPLIEVRFLTNKGAVAARYLIDQFQSGTVIDQDTFSDFAGLVPNAHPIVLDDYGRCSMYGTPGQVYTIRMRDPVTGAVEWSRDNVAIPAAASAGTFVPLDGSAPMTGLLTLSGPATDILNPVTLQQMNDALTAQLASLTTLVATATDAAAAATAAAAAVKPTYYELADAAGAAATRTITQVQPGTWQCCLETSCSEVDVGAGGFDVTVTQAGSCNGVTLSTSARLVRSGSAGYGRNNYGSDMKCANLVLTVPTDVTMSMAAGAFGSALSRGSRLTLSKIA